jgi:two-component system, chemotaxis family, chemotaxis protein CheY
MGVLVVDDDPFIREVIVELLQDEGYTVAQTANGEEALSYLQQQQVYPCVILLDLMMPKMNGWEFRAAQRQDPALAAIPVITISAHADLLTAASQLDVAGHFPKPIDMDRLLAAIQRYC